MKPNEKYDIKNIFIKSLNDLIRHHNVKQQVMKRFRYKDLRNRGGWGLHTKTKTCKTKERGRQFVSRQG